MENTDTTTAPSATTFVADAPARPPFRLHRSRTERMLGGVCGGLAESLDVDVTLLRIAFVVLTVLGGGIGIPLYIAAWIIAPEGDQAAL
jgi:phage shock protein C